MEKRKYTKTRRAVTQSRTRARIVDALVDLHQELGPAKTTIKAVAARAGVERLTVYRYFPDAASQLQACSSQYFELHPPPQKHQWASQANPLKRIRLALRFFYEYYRETADIFHHSYRDAAEMPEVKAILKQFESYLDAVLKDLLRDLPLNSSRRRTLKITLQHGLRFVTWESLERLGVGDREKVKLVSAWGCGAMLPAGRCAL